MSRKTIITAINTTIVTRTVAVAGMAMAFVALWPAAAFADCTGATYESGGESVGQCADAIPYTAALAVTGVAAALVAALTIANLARSALSASGLATALAAHLPVTMGATANANASASTAGGSGGGVGNSERIPCATDPHNCAMSLLGYTNARADISWSLDPDGIRNGPKNAATISRAMGVYAGIPVGLPGYTWVS